MLQTDKELKKLKLDSSCYSDEVFGLKKRIKVPCFSVKTELVPDIDPNYIFDETTTLSILAGFKFNKKVLVQGLHGTGKSSHIEQVSARLNWPCLRINLDGHISRFDLLGKDTIEIQEKKQVTSFKEGLLPWSIQNPVALVFDEYDAGRPEVMFIIQRILESEGKLTLLDQNKIIVPNRCFRIFGTCNTLGTGDTSGLYHGTQNLNQGQIDRWNIFTTLNYLKPHVEKRIIKNKINKKNKENIEVVSKIVDLANLIRSSFKNSDLSIPMSPRTCIIWAENIDIFGDIDLAFKLTFMNKCDESDQKIINEHYQRCFGREILEE